MRLFRAELSRLAGRRFTKVMTGLVLLILLAIGIGFAATSHPHNAASRAAALAQIEQIRQSDLAERQACEAQQQGKSTALSPNGAMYPPGFDCAQIDSWSPSEADVNNFEPHQFVFRSDAQDALSLLGFVLALLGFAVGASFVGAEWSTGGMMNLLLWRPRRLRVLFGKLAALLVGTLATGIVISVGWVVAMWAIASTRGDASRTTHGVLTSLALTDARALALMLAAAVLGFGVASVGRHTATALGAAVGYVVVLELGGRIVLQLVGVARPERFFLSNYAAAWLNKSQRYMDDSACHRQIGPGSCEPTRWMIHMNQGAVIWAVLLAVVLLLAFASMRRRDIT